MSEASTETKETKVEQQETNQEQKQDQKPEKEGTEVKKESKKINWKTILKWVGIGFGGLFAIVGAFLFGDRKGRSYSEAHHHPTEIPANDSVDNIVYAEEADFTEVE